MTYMKKFLSLLLVLAMLFCLCACGDNDVTVDKEDNKGASTTEPRAASSSLIPAERLAMGKETIANAESIGMEVTANIDVTENGVPTDLTMKINYDIMKNPAAAQASASLISSGVTMDLFNIYCQQENKNVVLYVNSPLLNGEIWNKNTISLNDFLDSSTNDDTDYTVDMSKLMDLISLEKCLTGTEEETRGEVACLRYDYEIGLSDFIELIKEIAVSYGKAEDVDEITKELAPYDKETAPVEIHLWLDTETNRLICLEMDLTAFVQDLLKLSMEESTNLFDDDDLFDDEDLPDGDFDMDTTFNALTFTIDLTYDQITSIEIPEAAKTAKETDFGDLFGSGILTDPEPSGNDPFEI